ncbi:MAG TPA: sigma-70 family RNA polymerase sigma factor [Acidobacteriaceae bacterium]|jgi:RNA polymerase sigma factor (TIGR02999 family)
MQASEPITLALQGLAKGDSSAFDKVMPMVYAELRNLAGYYLRQERKEHTLQPTALVHEAYFRLVGQAQPEYQNRSHFMGVAAHAMRQILIDHARTRNAAKRGGGQAVFSIDECMDAPLERPSALIQVDDALQALEIQDPRKAQLVEMRFFAGMTAEESAEALGLPVQKVRAELRIAQAWLKRELDNRNKSQTQVENQA